MIVTSKPRSQSENTLIKVKTWTSEKSPKWSSHGLQKSANILTKCNGIICADCDPRGQAQVKFATCLDCSSAAPRQISAHAEIPDLSIAVRGQMHIDVRAIKVSDFKFEVKLPYLTSL